jgi:enamine deaminase RidA (YjgF/YER057c/UK114 family)
MTAWCFIRASILVGDSFKPGNRRIAAHEQTGKIMYPGDFTVQCRYAFRKLKKVLARNGAGMSDVVKQVTFVVEACHPKQAGECRREAYGKAPLPAHTFLNVRLPGPKCWSRLT